MSRSRVHNLLRGQALAVDERENFVNTISAKEGNSIMNLPLREEGDTDTQTHAETPSEGNHTLLRESVDHYAPGLSSVEKDDPFLECSVSADFAMKS